MDGRVVRRIGLSSFLAASVAGFAGGQGACPHWTPGFEHVPHGVRSTDLSSNTIGFLLAAAFFDEGSGPRLFVGGYFDRAGALAISGTARWDGSTWWDVGSTTFEPSAFAVHDDGSGMKLYASGYLDPSHVVRRWDGTTWTAVGGPFPAIPRAMTTFDDGSGTKLYVASDGFHTGGQPFGRVDVWDGSSWSQVGGEFFGDLQSLGVFDDGAGSALYAGGGFTSAGSVAASNVAKWTGSAWAALGAGVAGGTTPGVASLAVYDDGSGLALFAGGRFTTAGGQPAANVARWDGSSWSTLGAGVAGTVSVLAAMDAGTGPKLYVGGSLSSAGGSPSGDVVAWDGASWSTLGTRGVENNSDGVVPPPFVAGILRDPSGSGLFAVGAFQYADGIEVNGVARWDGSTWSALGPPAGNGMNGFVRALATLDLGAGPSLYAGGAFTTASGKYATKLARWDGSGWSETATRLWGEVDSLCVFDDGGGPQIYLGGSVGSSAGNGLLRWNGSVLSSVPAASIAVGHDVLALASFDGGTGARLYAGGTFNNFTYHAIASWSTAGWSDVGGGTNGAVSALATYDDGSGQKLWVGGAFTTPGVYLARWDGSAWSTLPSSPDGHVKALCVFDDGNGSALYVGGAFTHVGGLAANRIAKWNGSAWSALGSGCDGLVTSMAVFDDGTGPALHVGGSFGIAGGIGALFVAKWDGTAWSAVGNGTSGGVFALAPQGPDLFVGGGFTSAGGAPSSYVAEWRGCTSPGIPMCFGDGSLATPCPCANFGAAGHGCQNSSLTGGAILGCDGTTVPDTVVLFAAGERPSALTIFLQGTQTLTAGVVFGDGLRCASGTLKRLYVKNASGGAASAPAPGEPSITARSAALGDPIAPGTRRYYQTYYRDSNAVFCPPPQGNTFNSSNAVKIVW